MTPADVVAAADEMRREGDGRGMARVLAYYLRLGPADEDAVGQVFDALELGTDNWQHGYDEGYDTGKMDARSEIPVEQMQDALKKAEAALAGAEVKLAAVLEATVGEARNLVAQAQKEIDW